MLKHILITGGIVVLLSGANNPYIDAKEDSLVSNGGSAALEFVIDTRQDFISLDKHGGMAEVIGDT
jgi:hypothetical protein